MQIKKLVDKNDSLQQAKREFSLILTPSQNQTDKPAKERLAHAKTAARILRKLTEADVRKLRAERKAGAKYADLMTYYGLAKSTISYIVNNKTYTP